MDVWALVIVVCDVNNLKLPLSSQIRLVEYLADVKKDGTGNDDLAGFFGGHT